MSRPWELKEHGDPAAERGVLLLPGSMCTAAFYDDVVADPRVADSDRRWIAATPPGFGGVPLPAGFVPTIEGYAALTRDLAVAERCDTIVGHSFFANVVLEMAAAGMIGDRGRIVLLSPCFRPENEESDFRMLNRLAKLPGIGRGVWPFARRIMPMAMKGKFPETRQSELVAEMQKTDPKATRQAVRHYFRHLAEHGTVAPRLCDSGVTAWVVRGDEDEIGLSDEDRARIEACPTVELVTVADAHHFVLVDQAAAVVDVVLSAVSTPTSA